MSSKRTCTSQPRSAFSGKQWKAKAAQRRCTQCIDNEAADARAAEWRGVWKRGAGEIHAEIDVQKTTDTFAAAQIGEPRE